MSKSDTYTIDQGLSAPHSESFAQTYPQVFGVLVGLLSAGIWAQRQRSSSF